MLMDTSSCSGRVNAAAEDDGFLLVVSRSGSQTSVSLRYLQITVRVCVCVSACIARTHKGNFSLPEVGMVRGFSNSNYNKAGRN